MYVTSMVAVQHYFDRRRAMATGLAVSGSGVGTLTFGLLTRRLSDLVGWRWTLVIEGAIMLLGCICGAIFKPLPHPEVTEDTNLVQEDGAKENGLYEVVAEEQGCCQRACKCGALLEVVDLSLFKNPVMCIYCFSVLMFCFGYHVPYTYTPERARQLGVDSGSASFLVSIMGMANVGSRLIFGWLADRSQGIRFYLAGSMLALGGFVSVAIPLFTTYPLMVLYSVMFGAFTGGWSCINLFVLSFVCS